MRHTLYVHFVIASEMRLRLDNYLSSLKTSESRLQAKRALTTRMQSTATVRWRGAYNGAITRNVLVAQPLAMSYDGRAMFAMSSNEC